MGYDQPDLVDVVNAIEGLQSTVDELANLLAEAIHLRYPDFCPDCRGAGIQWYNSKSKPCRTCRAAKYACQKCWDGGHLWVSISGGGGEQIPCRECNPGGMNDVG